MKTWPLLFIPVLTLSGLTVLNEVNAQPPASSYPGVVVPTHSADPRTAVDFILKLIAAALTFLGQLFDHRKPSYRGRVRKTLERRKAIRSENRNR